MENKFISLSYDLLLKGEDGKLYKYESATREKPFKFISGIGYALDMFESNVLALQPGQDFEFCIPADKAYGQYEKENVIELDKGIFLVDGKFDDVHVRLGAVIPLSDGSQTFNATVTNITDDKVTCDLNHPLAGEDLTFRGTVLESRDATQQEIDDILHPKCHGCSGHCGQGDCNCQGDCGDCSK
ncbi:MAG: FKBP-type peptidyl-prolyl cis-trans isomerase [Bacteroidaceae bacterium]|nr:FKBP-type peptidyl-prolyl cis-trans isomerase [Bacteroidaceae bacterium]